MEGTIAILCIYFPGMALVNRSRRSDTTCGVTPSFSPDHPSLQQTAGTNSHVPPFTGEGMGSQALAHVCPGHGGTARTQIRASFQVPAAESTPSLQDFSASDVLITAWNLGDESASLPKLI